MGRWRASWGVLAWGAVSIDVVGFGGGVGVDFLRLAVGYLSVCYLFVLFMSFCGVFCYVCSRSFCCRFRACRRVNWKEGKPCLVCCRTV